MKGDTSKNLSGKQIFFIVAALLGVFIFAVINTEAPPEKPSNAQQIASESAFSALNAKYQQADDQKNDLAKKPLEDSADKLRKNTPRVADGWQAAVKEIEAAATGEAKIVTTHGTTQYSLILVEPEAIKNAANLKQGEELSFSGVLSEEKSLTTSGGLSEPEFDVYPSKVIIGTTTITQSAETLAKQTPEYKRAQCKKNLKCWFDETMPVAAYPCEQNIEKYAKHSVKWTDGALEFKFGRAMWKDQEKGIITIIGDKVEFQNGFGAWTNMIYSCTYDPTTESVLGVTVEEGKL